MTDRLDAIRLTHGLDAARKRRDYYGMRWTSEGLLWTALHDWKLWLAAIAAIGTIAATASKVLALLPYRSGGHVHSYMRQRRSAYRAGGQSPPTPASTAPVSPRAC